MVKKLKRKREATEAVAAPAAAVVEDTPPPMKKLKKKLKKKVAAPEAAALPVKVVEAEAGAPVKKKLKKKLKKQVVVAGPPPESERQRCDPVEAPAASSRQLGRRVRPDPSAAILALAASSRSADSRGKALKKQEVARASSAKPKLDVSVEIKRILAAESAEDVLNVAAGESDENTVCRAWKQLVLLLHPDKLLSLDADAREAGANALQAVHSAKEEMKRRSQETSAEVPEQPVPDGSACLLNAASGSRKYEIKWKLPDAQDQKRPVEKYEVWGAKYLSEAGDPYDWVLLATLPPLQAHFVLVEEAPTQQDVMWAGDRIRRETLPLTVHAVNGKGSSEALTFEMPWATAFPWLQGASSVLCPRCCQLSQRRGAYSKCGGCGFSVPTENTLVVRCPDCSGEVLWSHRGSELSCTCCFKKLGGPGAQPHQPARPPPGHNGSSMRPPQVRGEQKDPRSGGEQKDPRSGLPRTTVFQKSAHGEKSDAPRWSRGGGGRSGGGKGGKSWH